MIATKIAALLVEDNPGDARLVREALRAARRTTFTIEEVDRLEAAIARLQQPGIDVVLLDLSLPDSNGMETLTRLSERAPHLPIVALSGADDEQLIQDAVKKGAEDYLIKGAFSSELLVRAIRYAIDRKQASDRLAETRDAALESARIRAEFLANMSHEIRTPLNGVIGMTRLLMDTHLTSDQREMAEIVRASADTLIRIVNDILDFSKISAGKLELEQADFNLAIAIESVVQIFAEEAQRKALEMGSFIESGVPVLLRGDVGRLGQILTNLIGNAVKFTPRGEVSVRIACLEQNDDEALLRFTVHDTGIGIPLDGQRHIFQAFAQADPSTTRKFGGSGLGLAIAAQLVELMGGEIGVQSQAGHGSTFWFTIRAHKQPAAQRVDVPVAQLVGVRVLVADHSVTSTRMIQDYLTVWGMSCDTTASAAETIARLNDAEAQGRPYAAAVIDLQMPAMDGLAFARAVSAAVGTATTRVIGMYSLGGRPGPSEMKAAGLYTVLAKPLKQTQLFNTMTAAAATPAAASRRRTVREIKSRIDASTRERLRLLLVEDNIVNQQVALRVIERLGYRAAVANHGREALEMMTPERYDIVLMDCQMPELDGYAATREIRQLEGATRHTIIIGLTAHALAGDREECLRVGMDDYISKPAAPEDLGAMLDKWAVRAGQPVTAAAATANPAEPATFDAEVLAGLSECERPGETDFVTHLIGLFLTDMDERIAEIRDAMETGTRTDARMAVHALKGSSAQVGAVRMREVCERLEETLRGTGPVDSPRLVEQLEHEAADVRVTLEAERLRLHDTLDGPSPVVERCRTE